MLDDGRRRDARGADLRGAQGGPVSGGIRTPGVERIHDPVALPAEDDLDRSLRPKRLDDFVGQERVKQQLAIFIEAARARGEALDHVLLAGPPGLGKTSLAQIVANELERRLRADRRPGARAQGRRGQLPDRARRRAASSSSTRSTACRRRSRRPSIRRWRTASCRSPSARARAPRVVTLDLPEFTLIGATTRTGLLTTPLRDRFGVTHRLELYAPAELGPDRPALGRHPRRRDRRRGRRGDRRPLARHAARRQPAAQARARLRRGARRGRDRRARRRARRLDLLEVDEAGLDRLDRDILRSICEKFGGGPVGLSTLSVAVGEESDTIEDVYEPYLLQQGFLMRTPRGRVATDAAFAHLGLEAAARRAPSACF